MAIDFKKIVLSNEVSIKNKVSSADDIYTKSMLSGIINESGDWMQKLKNTTDTQSMHGAVELASLNMNNNIPVIGATKSATLDVKSGGITQGQIYFSLVDSLTTDSKIATEQITDDLEAVFRSHYYALDDMVYGSLSAYQNLGIYGLVTNPKIDHGATSLGAIYSASTAEEIIADLKAYITGYYDDINADLTIRPINPNAVASEMKIPTSIMKVLRMKDAPLNTTVSAPWSVLEYMQAWTTRMMYNVTFTEDAGMELVPTQGGKGATYKVLMLGVFTKSYISLEIPNSPQRAGVQGKSSDWGFDIKSESGAAAYTMQVLGTQVMRSNMFLTRDV
jgi:hypothetical protein